MAPHRWTDREVTTGRNKGQALISYDKLLFIADDPTAVIDLKSKHLLHCACMNWSNCHLAVAKRKTRPVFLGLFLLITHSASITRCCPEKQLADSQSTLTSDGAPSNPLMDVRFAFIQKTIFDSHCVSNCHGVSNASADMKLAQSHSYKALVNTPSQQLPAELRVEPRAPERSYLVRKMIGGIGIIGEPMPKGQPLRPENELAYIRGWIARGASND